MKYCARYIWYLIKLKMRGANMIGIKMVSPGVLTFSVEGLSVKQLKAVTKGEMPAFARVAAVRLYELGEKDYAIDFLINQMNLFKDPKVHENIKRETCPEAAKALGKLRDTRAIEPLFEALGELAYGAAYGLAKINGPEVEKRLLLLAESNQKEGVYAAVALGYMKNQTIISKLIQILEHYKEYEEKIKDRWIPFIRMHTLRILGSYTGDKIAEDAFKKFLSKPDIGFILLDYLHQDKYRLQSEIEWEIVVKYGWDSYLDMEERRFAFRYTSLDRWKEYSNVPCPFESQAEVERLREKIIDQIWNEMMELPK
jgi:hypothetical protein